MYKKNPRVRLSETEMVVQTVWAGRRGNSVITSHSTINYSCQLYSSGKCM